METILKPNEKELETLTKVSEITGVDYDGKEWHQDLTPETLIEALKDMICEYHRIEEELEEHKKHCEEFHEEKKIDPYDYYGVSEKDFH